MSTLSRVGAAGAGGLVALGIWLVAAPWDLSEIDADGVAIESGGDDDAAGVFLVLGLVLALGLAAVAVRALVPYATAFVAGGSGTWVVLFTWRAGAARTVGANMFLVSVVVLVIPAALGATMAVWYLARRRKAGALRAG